MSYFIKCIAPSHETGSLYVVKNNKPHKLNHPASLDRDWFMTKKRALGIKRLLEDIYANYKTLRFEVHFNPTHKE